MSSNPKIKTEKPSAEEKALQQKQLELMEESAQRQRMFEPFYLETMGLEIDPQTGGLRYKPGVREREEAERSLLETTSGYTWNPTTQKYEATPEMARQQDIQRQLEERTLRALSGELPVDPALERSLQEGEERELAEIMQALGPGGTTSTPGIQKLAEYRKRAEELRTAARFGELTTTEALAQQREAATQGRAFSQMQQLTGPWDVMKKSQFAGMGEGYASQPSGLASNIEATLARLSQYRLSEAARRSQEYLGKLQAGSSGAWGPFSAAHVGIWG